MKSQRAMSLSFLGAILVSFLSCVILIVLLNYKEIHLDTSNFLLFIISCFIISFLIIYFSLNKYLINSLTPIYKNVIETKTGRYQLEEEKVTTGDMSDAINNKLKEWEEEKKQEIHQLTKMEMYRRDFLGNVSHELKTPIFSVQGYVHTLLDGGIEDKNINMLYLKKAAKSIDRLIAILDDLESVSKIEEGEMLLEKQIFDINELVKEVTETLEIMAGEQEIKLLIAEKSDNAYYVNADKNAIRQVLVNLIVNSIKYGNKNGVTEISFAEELDKIQVFIKDNGIGISPDAQNHLFERFYRVDKSRSREQGGTGLGLAIVKHIVEAHEGKIGVSSQPGIGSTFSFSLEKV